MDERKDGSQPSGCERVRARLEFYCTRDLSPLEAALDRGHLEACAECQVQRERVERLLVLLRELARGPEDDWALVASSTAERVSGGRRVGRGRWGVLRRQLLAAAAALFLLSALELSGGWIGDVDVRAIGARLVSSGLPIEWSSIARSGAFLWGDEVGP
jgi:hypothetical protein